MTARRVIGIGETVYDILFKDDQPRMAVPGGSTFNSLISLGRAGVACSMVTEVGDDHVGDLICDYMTANGVSTRYVVRHDGCKSHLSLAFLDERNDARYVFYKDHASITLEGETPDFGNDDIVLFGSFFALNPVIRSTVARMLCEARAKGAWLYYDLNFRQSHVADLPRVIDNAEENMRLADVVRGSTEDFYYVYGTRNADDIYRKVSRLCDTLIVTDGPREVRVYGPEGCASYATRDITTVSTVGAGDNFNAGYIYAKLQGVSNPDALIAMAQRWSQDVCRQMGNSVSDELVNELKTTQT